MIKWCIDNGNPIPSWHCDGHSISVQFAPRSIFKFQETATRPESRPESIQDKILKLLSSQPLSKSELASQLGQKHISGGLKKALQRLMQLKKISYTLPAKPKSRLQKYQIHDEHR